MAIDLFPTVDITTQNIYYLLTMALWMLKTILLYNLVGMGRICMYLGTIHFLSFYWLLDRVNVPGLLPLYIRNELETMYHFNLAKRLALVSAYNWNYYGSLLMIQIEYTNKELKEVLGLDRYNEVTQAREEQIVRGYH